jgi:hypothetical protein
MAWLWWLLAPVLSTIAGGVILAARSRREARSTTTRSGAMNRHEQLMRALQQTARPSEPPATMIVLEPAPTAIRPKA